MNASPVELNELIEQFYELSSGDSDLARFEQVAKVPPPYDQLLDHHAHMTVTVESFFGQPVDVDVHRFARSGDWYSREITLVTSQSKRVVQYGIVRLDTTALAPEVWQRIESRDTPLGRVLIEHNVLREVQLCDLWKVVAGPGLASLINCEVDDVLYGRTALIRCDGVRAIELLEIVTGGLDS